MGSFDIGSSALMAFQRALQTTGHNISNAHTEGYSRQEVELGTRPAQQTGAGYIGKGVAAVDVKRQYDEFLAGQVRTQSSQYEQVSTYHELSAEVDNLLADPKAGLTPTLEGFFGAVQDVSNDPSSSAAREVMLAEGESLARRFNSLDSRFTDLQGRVNTRLELAVDEVNGYADSVANLNEQIVRATGAAGGKAPNDLLDQRDLLLKKLAERVDVSTVEQQDGSVNVFVGTGQPLVVRNDSNQIQLGRDDANPQERRILFGGNTDITASMTGGEIGGLQDFQNEILDPMRKSLGRIAVGVAETFNAQHKLGMDLDNQMGGDFFQSLATVDAVPNSRNDSDTDYEFGATITDPSKLTTSDYELEAAYDDDAGTMKYSLQRVSDGSSIFSDVEEADFPVTTSEGFRIDAPSGANVADGDSWLIRPTHEAAGNMAMVLQDARGIAAAAPILAEASTENAGDATISAGAVNHPDNRVEITFTDSSTFDVVDKDTGATLAEGVSYSSGDDISYNGWTIQISDDSDPPADGDKFYVDNKATSTNSSTATISAATVDADSPYDENLQDTVEIEFIDSSDFHVKNDGSYVVDEDDNPVVFTYTPGEPISYNGWTATINGTPEADDTFTVSSNTSGAGDNRNALALAGVQSEEILDNGTADFQAGYGGMVAQVGTKTGLAEQSMGVQKTMLDSALEQHQSVSGVNMDEEAANLLKLQQSYMAAAKYMRTANELFNTLMNMT